AGLLVATSGRTGEVLWQNNNIPAAERLGFCTAATPLVTTETSELPSGDLDGDRIADLLVWKRSSGRVSQMAPLHAISGKSGRTLWNVAEFPMHGLAHVLAAETHDLNQDGQLEVLWLVA